MSISSQNIDGALRLAQESITDGHINTAAAIQRTKLAQDPLKPYTVSPTDWRVWDALHTNLPGTAASDDLALIGGTFGSASPVIRSSDAKAATITQRMRAMIRLPAEFDAGQTIKLRLRCMMITTVSDTTATVDVEAYAGDGEAGIGPDLCTTAATTINSLTAADKDFTIDASALEAGDWLDVRVTVAITDGATATAVIGQIGEVKLLCDVKG